MVIKETDHLNENYDQKKKELPLNLKEYTNENIVKKEEGDNMWDFFMEVFKKEGLIGLYKGITPLLMGNFISYGVYFFWLYRKF